jgi:hypothetical protein
VFQTEILNSYGDCSLLSSNFFHAESQSGSCDLSVLISDQLTNDSNFTSSPALNDADRLANFKVFFNLEALDLALKATRFDRDYLILNGHNSAYDTFELSIMHFDPVL